MKQLIFLILLAAGVSIALISGCAAPQRFEGTGISVLPPFGYIKLCAEHPYLAACQVSP